jgi:hypothetical protein
LKRKTKAKTITFRMENFSAGEWEAPAGLPCASPEDSLVGAGYRDAASLDLALDFHGSHLLTVAGALAAPENTASLGIGLDFQASPRLGRINR